MKDHPIGEQTAALQREIRDLERSLGHPHRGLLRRILFGPIGRHAQHEADVERAMGRQDQARELARLRAEQIRQSHEHADLVTQARAREDEVRAGFEVAQRDRARRIPGAPTRRLPALTRRSAPGRGRAARRAEGTGGPGRD